MSKDRRAAHEVGRLTIPAAILCLLISCQPADPSLESHGAIAGVALDATSGEPVAGARVTADATWLVVETVTDDSGRFVVVCDTGSVRIEVSARGYEEYAVTVTHDTTSMGLGDIELTRLSTELTLTRFDVITCVERYCYGGTEYYDSQWAYGELAGGFGQATEASFTYPDGAFLSIAAESRYLSASCYLSDAYGSCRRSAYGEVGDYLTRVVDGDGGFVEQGDNVPVVLPSPPSVSSPVSDSTLDAAVALTVRWTWPSTTDMQAVAVILGNYADTWAYVAVVSPETTTVTIPANTLSAGTSYELYVVGVDQVITAGQIEALSSFSSPVYTVMAIDADNAIDVDSIAYASLSLRT
jgi:hypothetical protein